MAEHKHWKLEFPSNYLGSQHLPDGKDIILKIKDVRPEIITGTNGERKESLVIYFEGDTLPMICNKTNAGRIAKVAGTDYMDEWVGVKIQLYAEMVAAFGKSQMALRVREFAPR